MNRRDLLEHIRKRIFFDDRETDKQRSHGVEKPVSKARKRRIASHEASPVINSFEDNVLRKVESIRASPAYKQCCRGLNGYEVEDDEVATVINKFPSYGPSSYVSKNIYRIEKEGHRKRIKSIGNGYLRTGDADRRIWPHTFFTKTAKEKTGMMKAVDVANGFAQNGRKSSSLLQSTNLWTRNKNRDAIEAHEVQSAIHALKSTNDVAHSADERRDNKTFPSHMHLNAVIGSNDSYDEIDARIKQSFTTLEELESNIDRAARFLQTSFSSRLSLSVAAEDDLFGEGLSSKDYVMEKHNDSIHLRLKRDVNGLTRGKTLGCRLKAHIAYGRNIAELSEHLRDVRGAFNTRPVSEENEVIDNDKNLFSDERSFSRLSSFYATVQQRMNEALQQSAISDDARTAVDACQGVMVMTKPTHRLLKESNHNSSDLSTSTFSKLDSVQNDSIANGELSLGSGAREFENLTEKNARVAVLDDSLPKDRTSSQGASQAGGDNSFTVEEMLKRNHYVASTVKALRQFYKDSVLYFAELRKLYCRQKVEDLWKVENEEEKITAACLLLKRKYIDSVHNTLSMKNFVDYHLHETARIQLLNLDVQKQLALLKGGMGELNFEKLRRRSEKVLRVTKDFEKNSLASRMEKWEQKLQTHLSGVKNGIDFATSGDSIRFYHATPVRVVRSVQRVQVRKSQNEKRLQLLREELRLKRLEADFLKRTFEQRMMRNGQSEESSLKAQIAAHERYIVETEKDIAQLISLENSSGGQIRKPAGAGTANITEPSNSEMYSAISSSLTSLATGSSKGTLVDGKFLNAGKNTTSLAAEPDSVNETGAPKGSPEVTKLEGIQFQQDISRQESEKDRIFGKSEDVFSAEIACSPKPSSPDRLIEITSQKLISPERAYAPPSELNRAGQCSTASNERERTSLPKEDKSAPSPGKDKSVPLPDALVVAEALAQLAIHSPNSNASSELMYNETGSFKQDASKEAVLVTVSHSPEGSDLQKQERKVEEESMANESKPVKDGKGRSSLGSVIDEQFFTPMASDAEPDENETYKEGIPEKTITQIESSSSFHTTISSPVQDVAETEIRTTPKSSLLLSSLPKPRKFKLALSPLASPRSPVSARYAATMPPLDSPRSIENSPRSPKALANRCLSPLAASLLETLLEDSLKTMLPLENRNNQLLPDETFVLDAKQDATLNPVASANNSWLEEASFNLSKVPVPQDLIPGLDLSGVHDVGAEVTSDREASPLEQRSCIAAVIHDTHIKSPEPLSLLQTRSFLRNETWVVKQIRSFSEQIWNLASFNQPFNVVVSGEPGGCVSEENQIRQMVADRCCEIAKQCFKNVGCSRYMGLANINFLRPRSLSHLISIIQKQMSKYYQAEERNAKEKKRWEVVSRDCNSDIENVVLGDLYADYESWEDILENYENDIKSELVVELWNDQLNDSLSYVTRI